MKTVIAMYDDFDTASRAVEALVDAGFDRDDISLIANNADDRYATLTTTDYNDDDVKAGEGAGFGAVVGTLVGLGVALIPGIGPVIAAGPLAAALMAGIGAAAGAATGGVVAGLVDMGVPEEDAHIYAEGIRRGGALVSLDIDTDEHVDRAEEILNRYNPSNIDERGETYRSSGWSGFDSTATPYSASQINDYRSSTTSTTRSSTMPTNAVSSTRTVNPGEQQKLEVVEENLEVGKREVEGGTVRVHTRVTERPVQEQVNLHEERVVVDRRPVNRAASPADLDTFEEGTIEVTEKREVPVVSKTARVVEEVVVGKEASDHLETVQDTVRRKDVEVEGTGTQYRPYSDYETTFRSRYNSQYANSGYTWEDYSPAYRYGYTLATNPQYRDTDWNTIQSSARTQWEAEHPNTWERFKDSIRDAWDEIRGRR